MKYSSNSLLPLSHKTITSVIGWSGLGVKGCKKKKKKTNPD